MNNVDLKKYVKIRLNALHPSIPIPFNLYLYINKHYILYLRAGDQLSQAKLDKFDQKAPDSFYIDLEDRIMFKSHIQAQMKSSKISTKDRAMILRESSLSLVEELFESPDVERALAESKQIISEFIEFIDTEPEGASYLIGLSSHDFYTYTHSLDVSIYSLGLAKIAGYLGPDLAEMGQGALFHDIGKRDVSVDIICKEGPLDDLEWEQMKMHPQFGIRILNELDVSDAVLACCLEHHESALGNGYPQQLEAHEIHPMARIVALTDTYDALTTKRSYNQPLTPSNAIEMMENKLANRYDPDLLKAMVEVFFKMKKMKASA